MNQGIFDNQQQSGIPLQDSDRQGSILDAERRVIEECLSDDDLEQCFDHVDDQRRRNRSETDVRKNRESQNNQYKNPIDEYKLREKQKLEEYAQFKLENDSLHKKVFQLMQSAEGMKYTIVNLQEKLEDALEQRDQNKIEIDKYKLWGKKKIEKYAELKNENESLQETVFQLQQNNDDMILTMKRTQKEAHEALANQKRKYEDEKDKVAQKMMKLQNELRALKEDAASFEYLRSAFAQKCNEYKTQLGEQQKQIKTVEEEKKTLQCLLNTAMQQELRLTQQEEDLEYDRDRRMRRQTSNPIHEEPDGQAIRAKYTETRREFEKSEPMRHTPAINKKVKGEEMETDVSVVYKFYKP